MGETDRIPYRVAEGTPETLDELRYFVVNEFRRIQQALTEIDAKLIDLEDRITEIDAKLIDLEDRITVLEP